MSPPRFPNRSLSGHRLGPVSNGPSLTLAYRIAVDLVSVKWPTPGSKRPPNLSLTVTQTDASSFARAACKLLRRILSKALDEVADPPRIVLPMAPADDGIGTSARVDLNGGPDQTRLNADGCDLRNQDAFLNRTYEPRLDASHMFGGHLDAKRKQVISASQSAGLENVSLHSPKAATEAEQLGSNSQGSPHPREGMRRPRIIQVFP